MSRLEHAPAALAFGIFTLALWALQHPYPGIYHDAQLYTLQALAHEMPDALSNDIYLRYGSQDRFTFFSPIYALVIHAVGTGTAAALLTAVSHAMFAGALVLLARGLLPLRLGWLAVGLVCVIPFTYGARKVFYLMEDFVTPRLLAQAFVLAALAALLGRRHVLALLAAIAAFLLHPIMAAAGLAVAVLMSDLSKRPWLLLALALSALATPIAILWITGAQLRFDDAWWALVHGGLPYLFPLQWRALDWARVLVVASTLYAGLRCLPDARQRRLCGAALFVTAAGIALAIVGGDLLRLVFVTQLQPWRVLWIASVLALLMSPVIAVSMWRAGAAGRIACVGLLAAFLLADERFALSTAVLAAAAVIAATHLRREPSWLRTVLLGMFALLALAVVINLLSGSIVARGRFDQSEVGAWLTRLRHFTGTGLIPALLLCAALWVLERGRRAETWALAAASVASFAVIALAAWPQWSRTPLSRESHAAFASWRAVIPRGTEVLWPGDPVAIWGLLERPSYASSSQGASALFSRTGGLETHARLQALVEWFPELRHSVLQDAKGPAATLATLCAVAHVRYVVTTDVLESPPLAIAPDDLPASLRGRRLYGCPASR